MHEIIYFKEEKTTEIIVEKKNERKQSSQITLNR